jgi:hypothetical protein
MERTKFEAPGLQVMSMTQAPFRLTFAKADCEPHGTLFEQADGTLAFTGNVDRSAATFFDCVVAHQSAVVMDANARIARLSDTVREALASGANAVAIPQQVKMRPYHKVSVTEFIELMLTEPASGTEQADELKACRTYWESHRGRLGVFADFWQGWLACSTVRAKA